MSKAIEDARRHAAATAEYARWAELVLKKKMQEWAEYKLDREEELLRLNEQIEELEQYE